MLKTTGIKLEPISDIDMHLFIEKGMRGGISNISKRYSEANNKYMKCYGSSEWSKFIMYWDAIIYMAGQWVNIFAMLNLNG